MFKSSKELLTTSFNGSIIVLNNNATMGHSKDTEDEIHISLRSYSFSASSLN
jgi:hypothetical protein